MAKDGKENLVSNVIIRELTPELLGDYLSFFDGDAFMDNPEWAGCYCMYYHFLGTYKEWEARSPSENRAAVSELILRGKAHGLLAYIDEKLVGWCHAAPRTALPKLDTLQGLGVDDAEQVGSIVCFVVAAPFRRRGIAHRLLEAACDMFIRWGLSIAEAYPHKKAKTDAENWRGPLSLYLSAGFKPFRELNNRIIVRKRLRK